MFPCTRSRVEVKTTTTETNCALKYAKRVEVNEMEETETALVLVELSGIIDSNFLHEKEKSARILGVDTAQPVLQIDNYVFSGEYEDTVGTVVIFEEIASDGQDKQLKYVWKTNKKLAMKRAFLQEKKSAE